tara:strand:+ start:4723 stop:5955 length:1233 start_codon:yes stop_codon:yes gene_type:complete
MRMQNLKIFAVLTLLGGVFQKLIPFLTSIVVANIAGEIYFAQFTFALNTANTIVAVCAMGLSPAILTTLSVAKESKPEVVHDEILGLLRVGFMVAVTVAIVGFTVANFPPASVANSAAYFSIVILAPALVLNQVTYAIFQGITRYKLSAVQSFGLFILVLSCVFGGAAAGFGKSIHVIYAWSYLVVGMASFSLLTFSSLKRRKKKYPSPNVMSLISRQLPFAGYTAVWMLAMYLCNYKVAHSYSSSLAIYNASFQWYTILLMAPSLLGGVLIPYFSSRIKGIQVVRITAIYTLIGIPPTIFLMYLAPHVLGLYSLEANANSLLVFRLMLASGALATVTMPMLQLYLAQRNFIQLYVVSGAWTLVALPGVFVFSQNAIHIASWFFVAYIVVALIVGRDLKRLTKKLGKNYD